MKLLDAIYHAPTLVNVSEENNKVDVHILYRDKLWKGSAYLHPEDKDFFSAKVGKRIALSRARTKILKYEENRLKELCKQRELFYTEVRGYGSKNQAEVDPTGAFIRNLDRCFIRYNAVKEAISKEENSLKNYLEDYKKAIGTVKKMRESQNKVNNN